MKRALGYMTDVHKEIQCMFFLITLLQALLHYHPDKNLEEAEKSELDADEAMRWKVFCQEITKILNNKLEIHK